MEYHGSTPDSIGHGLDACEYQAARVIAISTVEEAAMKGKVAGNDIKREVLKNTNEVAKSPAFKKWVKDVSTSPRMKELGEMTPDEVRADFVKSMSKDMEKEACRTGIAEKLEICYNLKNCSWRSDGMGDRLQLKGGRNG